VIGITVGISRQLLATLHAGRFWRFARYRTVSTIQVAKGFLVKRRYERCASDRHGLGKGLFEDLTGSPRYPMTTDNVRCPYCVDELAFKLMRLHVGRFVCDRCGHVVDQGEEDFWCECPQCHHMRNWRSKNDSA